MQVKGATLTVEWGYELHSITLTARNWRRIKAGRPLRIRGKGYYYEGEFFWDYWTFNKASTGSLLVEYGDGGVGFDGDLDDATVEEHDTRAPAEP
jgi:hypothetical protein